MINKFHKQDGFTLIEVLVTVAIIAILSAIGITSYDYYTQKSRRTSATTTLEHVRSLLEQYYVNNKTYPTNLTALGYTNSPLNVNKTGDEVTAVGSTDIIYQISVNQPGTKFCTNCNYEIIATAQNLQAKDTNCEIIWYNAVGQKGGVDSTGAASPNCW